MVYSHVIRMFATGEPGVRLVLFYRIQINNYPIRARVCGHNIMRYQVTDPMWLRYQAHLAVG